MNNVRQCVFLVGGLGTRLGELARDIPKPMMPVARRPFLDHLLAKAARHGFDRVLLLAGHRAEVIARHLDETGLAQRLGLEIEISIEPAPLGTGGALTHARDRLDPAFILVNGDTWFDFDWRLLADWRAFPASLALREVAPADRYETVALDDDGRVIEVRPRDPRLERGLINGGVCRLIRDVVPSAVGVLSLETDLLPKLCATGDLGGQVFDGAFIDIGLPESLAAASNVVTDGQ